jgi:alpha-amylase
VKRTTGLFLFVCLLAACVPASPTPTSAPTSSPAVETWWTDATFYEVFVRSFYDGNGDGNGDLPGLIEKLDYLNDGDLATSDDLGVTALWLMPIFQSPSYHGYDVTDYYTVNTDYGTNDDFKRLMDEAHQRGIRIIIDLVLNHTSSQHPWFLDSASGPDAEKRDWYIWTDENPGYLGPWGQQVWHEKNSSYYYGVFWDGMPDLNLENPEVTAALQDIARFWLEEMGVDGIRLDAVKHFVEDGKNQVHTPASREWLASFYDFVKSVNPDAFVVGEAWDSTTLAAMYTRDGVDAVFEFSLAEAILDSVNRGRASAVTSAMRTVQRSYEPGRYAPFLTNHDQDRTMNVLGRDWDKARQAASVLLTLPGPPFAYYGEEIGMTGVKPDEQIRTPMQWTSGPNAGFTTGHPWQAVNTDYEEKNVDLQAAEPGSLLNHYRRLIALRHEHPALRGPEYVALESVDPGVYAYLRSDADEVILVVHHLGPEAVAEYALSLAGSDLPAGRYGTTDLLAGTEAELLSVESGGAVAGYQPLPELPSHATLILLLAAAEE